jgi:hypothetical protein
VSIHACAGATPPTLADALFRVGDAMIHIWQLVVRLQTKHNCTSGCLLLKGQIVLVIVAYVSASGEHRTMFWK